jgi:hypothetical protein
MPANVTVSSSARPASATSHTGSQRPLAFSQRADAGAPFSANPTAVVYCEGNFAAIDGKTANGLVRHSEKYEILSVIDSSKAGLDAGHVLDGTPNGVPICSSLEEAVAREKRVPDFLIFGVAPSTGMLSPAE